MAGSIRSEGKEPSLRDLTRVNITNLGRDMYPALHVTKQEVITYHIIMARRILPFVHNRPLSPSYADGPLHRPA